MLLILVELAIQVIAQLDHWTACPSPHNRAETRPSVCLDVGRSRPFTRNTKPSPAAMAGPACESHSAYAAAPNTQRRADGGRGVAFVSCAESLHTDRRPAHGRQRLRRAPSVGTRMGQERTSAARQLRDILSSASAGVSVPWAPADAELSGEVRLLAKAFRNDPFSTTSAPISTFCRRLVQSPTIRETGDEEKRTRIEPSG